VPPREGEREKVERKLRRYRYLSNKSERLNGHKFQHPNFSQKTFNGKFGGKILEYNLIFFSNMQPFQRVNHFLGMYNIARKNTTAVYTSGDSERSFLITINFFLTLGYILQIFTKF
jgi:hypothetical protein